MHHPEEVADPYTTGSKPIAEEEVTVADLQRSEESRRNNAEFAEDLISWQAQPTVS